MGYNRANRQMQTKKIIIAALLLASVQVCLAQKKEVIVLEDEKFGYDEATAHSIDPVASAHTTPVVADLTVTQTRITHKETFSNNLTAHDLANPGRSAEIRYLKDYTLTRAAKLNNADIIIAPTYDIKTSQDMNTITVEITGYPASYVNFRKATNADLDLIKNGFLTSSTTAKPSKSQTTVINSEQ